MSTHIADRNRERTREFITAKLDLLEVWSTTEIPWKKIDTGDFAYDTDGEKVLDFFPTREIHFAEWNGSQNCPATHIDHPALAALRKTRRSTLLEPYHEDLHARLVALLPVVRAKAQEQLIAASKTNIIQELRASAEYWETLAHKQESDIISLRERMHATEVTLRSTTLALNNNIHEHQRVVDALTLKVANLTDLLSKIAPLR